MFDRSVAKEKFRALNGSQESVEGTAGWFVHHHANALECVEIWSEEIRLSDAKRCLILVHLANDILQTSRRKGPEYMQCYSTVLPVALPYCVSMFSLPQKQKLQHVIDVWRERQVSFMFALTLPHTFLKEVSVQPRA